MTRQDGESKYVQTHRIIAEVFCARLPGQDLVRHLDDNRMNSKASNLAWGTRGDNAKDAIANGKIQRGLEHHAAFIKDEEVKEIFLSRESAHAAARRHKISPSYVSNIRTRRARADATEGLGVAPGAVGMGGKRRGVGDVLTKENVTEIYTTDTPSTELARKFGVSATHVLRIRQGIKWADFTKDLPQAKYRKSIAGIRINADGSFTGRSITGEQAVEIFLSPERGRDIARRFDITEALVSAIRKRGQWSHLTKGLTQPRRANKGRHRNQVKTSITLGC
jgi:hypothetical protein